MEQSLRDQLLALQKDLRDIQKRMEDVEKQLAESESEEPVEAIRQEAEPVQPTPIPETELPPVESKPPESMIDSFAHLDAEEKAESVDEREARPASEPVMETPIQRALEKHTEPVDEWDAQPAETLTWTEMFTGLFGDTNPLGKLTQRVFSGNPIVKVGILVLFLGLAFALRYVAERGWLPIWSRYIAVAATGIALLVLGWRWRKREDAYGLVMQGGGVGVLYLTTLAAMKLHPLLNMGAGFSILVIVAAIAAALAVMQNAMVLAIIAALGGFAAPVLSATGVGNHIILFSYLTILNLGFVSIAWFKSWRILNIIGYVSSFSLGSAWAVHYYRDELFWTTEPFLLLLFVIYVLITVLFARRTLADLPEAGSMSRLEQAKNTPVQVRYVDGSLAFGVPFSAFWVQHYLVEPFQNGTAITAAGFGIFYFLVAYLLVFRTGKRYVLLTETLVVLGFVFSTLAIPLLETTWTSAAWAAEAAGVFWVGYRQRQTYVRFIALAVLFGSAVYFLPELRFASNTVLEGPVLSAVLLSASTGITYWLVNWSKPGVISEFESWLRPVLVAFGGLMLATIPLLIFRAEWAGPTLAILGAGLIFAGARWSDRRLLNAGWIYQIAGGGLFLTTLQGSPGDTVLAEGWSGVLTTCLTGAAMLAGSTIVRRKGPWIDAGAGSAFAPAHLALYAGLAFVNLSPLFVLPWRYAAMVWPMAGIAVLIWAIRSRHAGTILFALGLQLIAGLAHSYARIGGDALPVITSNAGAFLNSGFIGPMVISLAALVCAYIMRRDLEKGAAVNTFGWLGLAWAGVWWSFAWYSEIDRVTPMPGLTAALTAAAVVTVWLMSALSGRLDWLQLRKSTVAYLPVLMLIAIDSQGRGLTHPLQGWNALAWPAALAMHGFILQRQETALQTKLLEMAHIAGAWFFLLLFTIELRWWAIEWSDPASAWPVLAMILLPVLYAWALTLGKIQSLWPVSDHHHCYVLESAVPVMVFLLAWLWNTNFTHAGGAQPLVYIPLLNPLELGYLAVMYVGVTWWRMVKPELGVDETGRIANTVLAATAFAALTGGVVRACHHWANIPWTLDSLMASYTVQTSLSIVWGLLAISCMILGHRRRNRTVWIAGSGLVVIVVLKLFLVELSASGTLQRIVSFIVVGLLLLVVGYFAPLPPRRPKQE